MRGQFFPSSAEMVAVLGPVVKDAAEQLGSLANIYQLADVLQADKSSVREPNSLPIEGIAIKLTELTGQQSQDTFGLNTNVTMKGKMARLTDVQLGDVFEIYEGAFSGKNLQVNALIERPLSDSYLIGFIDYEGDL